VICDPKDVTSDSIDWNLIDQHCQAFAYFYVIRLSNIQLLFSDSTTFQMRNDSMFSTLCSRSTILSWASAYYWLVYFSTADWVDPYGS